MIKAIKIISMALLLLLHGVGCTKRSSQAVLKADMALKIPYHPSTYVCYLAQNNIVVDGILDDDAWQKAPWSKLFVDIEGELKPKPAKDTRVKMLWDSSFFYIAAELMDDHVWGTLTDHDAVIFYDNDFEVFIDPDGDTHHYLEFEMNALNTTWDLMLSKPYRDGGLVFNSWEIPGMKSAVKVYGSINDPSDTDEKWTLELAFPWRVLNESARGAKMPADGTQWRINFSRVQWPVEIVQGEYVKIKDENGKKLPENNWVWSPQGVIAMHRPETWGYVQFSADAENDTFLRQGDEDVKWALRQLYYRQNAYYEENNFYATDGKALRLSEVLLRGKAFIPEIVVHQSGYTASYPSQIEEGMWFIQNDGRIWLKKQDKL